MAHIKTESKWVRPEFPNPTEQAVCIFWNICCEVCVCIYTHSLSSFLSFVLLCTFTVQRRPESHTGPLQAENNLDEGHKTYSCMCQVWFKPLETRSHCSKDQNSQLAGKSTLGTRENLVNYEVNDFPMQDWGDFLPSTGTPLSLPAHISAGDAGNPSSRLGCAFPAVTLQGHCSEMQLLKASPCLTVLLLCLEAFIFSSYIMALYRIQNQTVPVFL